MVFRAYIAVKILHPYENRSMPIAVTSQVTNVHLLGVFLNINGLHNAIYLQSASDDSAIFSRSEDFLFGDHS